MSAAENMTSRPRVTALVMAASRLGQDDPVARLQGKSHKCLVEIDGTVMLEIVIDALVESGRIDRIVISIENEDVLRATPRLSAWLDDGTIGVSRSEGNLADSVVKAVHDTPDPYPLVVTTGDNAMHTPELVRDYVDQFMAGDGDVSVAFTSAEIVRRDYPNSGLAYHRLKDGGFSSCNLYGLRRERALKAVGIFKSGGQFGKRHMRLLKSIGITPFIYYKLKATTLDGLIDKVARNLGVTADTVHLDYPYGPIDVDNAPSFAMTEETLKRRRSTAPAESA